MKDAKMPVLLFNDYCCCSCGGVLLEGYTGAASLHWLFAGFLTPASY